MTIGILADKQNRDGGWPYIRGSSWVEPTAYAVLAMLAAGETERARRGLRWILALERPDGGWPPQAVVDQSTWVTALVALLPAEELGARAHARAIAWLLETTGRESTLTYRFREWLLGNAGLSEQEPPGWPWTRDTSSWVGPTSLAVLALEKEYRRRHLSAIRERIDSGRRFLLSRMCREGGWNHGSVRPLGYDCPPYPETTGMALAALCGVRSSETERSLAVAQRFLGECRSADALNWLRLGLRAHGQLPAGYCHPLEVTDRTLPDMSLGLLVAEAEKGRDFFLG
jgi:hypothetical protein